jgi:hypothetical protein
VVGARRLLVLVCHAVGRERASYKPFFLSDDDLVDEIRRCWLLPAFLVWRWTVLVNI